MMKAVVVEKPEKITVVERAIPEITDNQVLLKVKAAGISRCCRKTRKDYCCRTSYT